MSHHSKKRKRQESTDDQIISRKKQLTNSVPLNEYFNDIQLGRGVYQQHRSIIKSIFSARILLLPDRLLRSTLYNVNVPDMTVAQYIYQRRYTISMFSNKYKKAFSNKTYFWLVNYWKDNDTPMWPLNELHIKCLHKLAHRIINNRKRAGNPINISTTYQNSIERYYCIRIKSYGNNIVSSLS